MIGVHFKHLSPSYRQRSLRRLELYVFAWIGDNPISAITPKDLLEVFKRIENANKSPTVKKTREVINLVFKHALLTGHIKFNPCDALRGVIRIAFSYGENIAIFFKTKNEEETEVEVVSKRAMETNIFAPDWSKDIHNELQMALKN
jgi:hypothetical protein